MTDIQTFLKRVRSALPDDHQTDEDWPAVRVRDVKALCDEVERLNKDLRKEAVRKEAAYRREEILEQDMREMKRDIFRSFADEECWIFADDGEDYPDSLVCPVVMSADKLRELLQSRAEVERLRDYGEPVVQAAIEALDSAMTQISVYRLDCRDGGKMAWEKLSRVMSLLTESSRSQASDLDRVIELAAAQARDLQEAKDAETERSIQIWVSLPQHLQQRITASEEGYDEQNKDTAKPDGSPGHGAWQLGYDLGKERHPAPKDGTASQQEESVWPKKGDLVRYSHGSTALAILGDPHAGGWHGAQCMGGSTYFSDPMRPTIQDMFTWLNCAKWRDGKPTTEADERVKAMLAAASQPGGQS